MDDQCHLTLSQSIFRQQNLHRHLSLVIDFVVHGIFNQWHYSVWIKYTALVSELVNCRKHFILHVLYMSYVVCLFPQPYIGQQHGFELFL